MENKEPFTLNFQKDNIPECVQYLYIYSEKGNSKKLKEITDNNEYSGSKLNIALRKLISKFELNSEYEKCIYILMSLNIKINYKYTLENSSTILMQILGKGDVYLLKLFIEASKNKDINNATETINFNIRDANNRNAIHYLFIKNSIENDVIDILDYLLNDYCKNNKNLYNNIIDLLDIPDLDGNVPLGICLLKGWYNLTLKLIKLVKKTRHQNNKKNNFIHCAVLGSSILCLKIILFYSQIEDFKLKNCDNLTPYLLAYKNNFFQLSKIIEDYDNNFYNQIYKMSFFNESERYLKKGYNDLIINTLNYFIHGEYENCIENLKICQYYQNYIEPGNNKKTNNVSIEWNNLLTKYKLNLNSELKNYSKDKDNENKKSINNQKNNFFFHNLEKFRNFFEEKLNTLHIKDENYEETKYDISKKHLLIYNKVIFHLKCGEFNSLFSTINLYLTNIFPDDNSIIYKWVIYINSTLLLSEIFISLDYIEVAEILLNSLVTFLSMYKNNNDYSIYDKTSFEYLNENEIINQYSKKWDELICYINLLKMIMNIQNPKKFASKFKYLIKECNYISKLKIFNRLKILYICLKVKKNYFIDVEKCFLKLKLLEEDNMYIFYHNSLGILNLKLKNFFIAEFHFKNALHIYNNSLKNNKQKSKFDFRIDYICSIKFNISLCYFYQGKYVKARKILLNLLKIRIMKNNYKIWFRLGLCSKEIELSKNKLNNNSTIINLIKGYNKEKNNEKNPEKDYINIELKSGKKNIKEEEIFLDELYKEFVKEYKYIDNVNVKVNKNIALKRIILKSSYESNMIFKNSIYINESINSFKKVIFLSKNNLIKNQSIKNIIQIYYNKVDKNNKEFFLNNKLRININILCETYLNLIFCLSLKEEWNEIIIIIKEFKKRGLAINEDIDIKIEQFEIEAYINLKYYDKAKKYIINSLNKHKDFIQNLNYLNKGYFEIINDVSFKINLLYGLSLINIKLRNYKECEENIIKMYNLFPKKNDLPNYFIDLIIYINLIKLDESNFTKTDYLNFKNNILNIIKMRKFKINK